VRLPVALLALLLAPPWPAWGQQDAEGMREIRRQRDRELPGKHRPDTVALSFGGERLLTVRLAR
jgi:hypothetical protein